MIEINGSIGEAGGQVLRTALGLSCLLKKPFHIFNIRKGRKKPGLMPQHLMCVHAVKEILSANVRGDKKDSTELSFEPVKVKTGSYLFDIGTAGSTTLLLQAILPALAFTNSSSFIFLKGGTHVPFSPTFQYIKEVFIPILHRLGIEINAEIEQYGFYPKGGGRININVMPSGNIKSMSFLERGRINKIKGISGVGNLPISIAKRQKEAALKVLMAHMLDAEIDTISIPAYGQGTFIFLKVETDNCVVGFSALGERGKKAEIVGEEAARKLTNYINTSACFDNYISDQILPYLAMISEKSYFTTSCITNHLLTNLSVIEKFLKIDYIVEGKTGSEGKITIKGVLL